VATIGYVGSVAGPIMIGWLAEATSLRLSLALVVLLTLVIALLAGTVSRRRPALTASARNHP
jgi:MFS family permease